MDPPLAPLRAALRRGVDEPQWEESRAALAETGLFSRAAADGDDDRHHLGVGGGVHPGAPPLELLQYNDAPLARAAAFVRSTACALAAQAVATASRLRHVESQLRMQRARHASRAAASQHEQVPHQQPFRPAGVSRCGAQARGDGRSCTCHICQQLGPFTPPHRQQKQHSWDGADTQPISDAWDGTPFKAALLTSLARQLRLSLAFQIFSAKIKLRAARAAAVTDACTPEMRETCRMAFNALAANARAAAAARRKADLFACDEGRASRGAHRVFFAAWRRKAAGSVLAREFARRRRLDAAFAHWRLFMLLGRRQKRLDIAARTLFSVGHALARSFHAWRIRAHRNANLGRRIVMASAQGQPERSTRTGSRPHAPLRERIAHSRAAALAHAHDEARAPAGTVALAAALVRRRRFTARNDSTPQQREESSPAPPAISARRLDGASMSLLATADAAAQCHLDAQQRLSQLRPRAEALSAAASAAAGHAASAHAAWREAERQAGATAAAAVAAEQDARNALVAQPNRRSPSDRLQLRKPVVPSVQAAQEAAHQARVVAAEAEATANALRAACNAADAEHRAAAAAAAQAVASVDAALGALAHSAAVAKATALAAQGPAMERVAGARRDVTAATHAFARATAACDSSDRAVADARMRLCAAEAACKRAEDEASHSHVALTRGAAARAAIEKAAASARQLAHASAMDATLVRRRVVKGPGAKAAAVAEADALVSRARKAANAGAHAAQHAAQRLARLEELANDAAKTAVSASQAVQMCRQRLTQCLAAQAAAHTAKRQAIEATSAARARLEKLTSKASCPVLHATTLSDPSQSVRPADAPPRAPRPSTAAVLWARTRVMHVAFAAWRAQSTRTHNAEWAACTKALLARAVRLLRHWHHLSVTRHSIAAAQMVPFRMKASLHAWASITKRNLDLRAAAAAAQSRHQLGGLRAAFSAWRAYSTVQRQQRDAVEGAMMAAAEYCTAASIARTRPRVFHAWRALVTERRRIAAGAEHLLEVRLKGILRAWKRFAHAASLLRRVLDAPLREHAAHIAAEAHSVSAARAVEVLLEWRRIALAAAAERNEAASDVAADALRRSWLLARGFSALAAAPQERRLLRACIAAWSKAPRAKGSRCLIAGALLRAGYMTPSQMHARLRTRCIFSAWRRYMADAAAVAASARKRRLQINVLRALLANVARRQLDAEQMHGARVQFVRWRRDVPFAAWRDLAAATAKRRDAVADMRVSRAVRILHAWRDLAQREAAGQALQIAQTRAAAAAVLAALQARAAQERLGAPEFSGESLLSARPTWLPPSARALSVQHGL